MMPIFEYLEDGKGEGVEDADKDHSVAKLLGKRKAPEMPTVKMDSNPAPVIKTKHDSSASISLPHLVYKLDFSENDDDLMALWNVSSEDDFLKNIMTQNSGKNVASKKKHERKVVVVFELPSGGEVTQYCIGDTDDTLEVQVRKHGLMLNPQALLYSGLKVGALDPAKDGPLTNRGGIRLLECSKALQKYTMSQKVKQDRGEKNDENHLSLKFNLPDFVSKDKAIAYSYCFEKDRQNGRSLQYAIAYFEFQTKEATSTQGEKFTKISSIHFSDSNNSSNNSNGNSGGTNFFGPSTTSGNANRQQPPRPNNQGHPQQTQNNTACNHSAGAVTNSSSTSNGTNLPNSAPRPPPAQGKVLTEEEIEQMIVEVEEKVSKKYETVLDRARVDFSKKMKLTEQQLLQQTEHFKKCDAERLAEINQSREIINKQQAILDKISHENESIKDYYEMRYKALENELEKVQEAHSKDKQNIVTVLEAPRTVQYISDFASAVENGSVLPTKRGRLQTIEDEDTAERSVSVASSAEVSDFFQDLNKNDLSLDGSSSNTSISETSKGTVEY